MTSASDRTVPEPASGSRVTYALTRGVLWVLLRLLFRTRVTGLNRVPRRGPVILASNHRSFVDSLLIPLIVRRRVRFLAKAEYFTGPGIRGAISRNLFTTVGAIPVERDTQRSALGALEQGLTVLRDGEGFALYPEGTRSRDGRLYKGRTGVGWLALASGAPVIPVGLRGTAEVQPADENRIRLFRTLWIDFGTPVMPQDYAHLPAAGARRALTDAVMDQVATLCKQPLAGVYNDRQGTAET